ncbi:hypothetical protein DQX05_02705 [Paenibacillus thiaminolyticus]|uniref:Uncharacterized protein n=1 Tax=Paenibacillus thiaminolyticus TaxID=49283 RepID=A0A3A3GT21_PANTH|nr:hypothetical protein DQX05_02705 [Paenibacillus thiaminolyticus]
MALEPAISRCACPSCKRAGADIAGRGISFLMVAMLRTAMIGAGMPALCLPRGSHDRSVVNNE